MVAVFDVVSHDINTVNPNNNIIFIKDTERESNRKRIS